MNLERYQLKLRGHHLLCILTYIGLGYSDGFTKNMSLVVGRINQGAEIEIVSGIDDICSALQMKAEVGCEHAETCHQTSVRNRDYLALSAIAESFNRPVLKVGDKIILAEKDIMVLRQKFASGTIRQACEECPWHDTCSTIAKDGFTQVKLMPQAIA